jgi:hypothetical protein
MVADIRMAAAAHIPAAADNYRVAVACTCQSAGSPMVVGARTPTAEVDNLLPVVERNPSAVDNQSAAVADIPAADNLPAVDSLGAAAHILVAAAVDNLPVAAHIHPAAAANIPEAVEDILVDRRTVDIRAEKDVSRTLRVQVDYPSCIRSTCCQPYLISVISKKSVASCEAASQSSDILKVELSRSGFLRLELLSDFAFLD